MKNTKNDGLFISGTIFLVGFIFVSIFNYLYHLFMGRMLGPTEYGVLGSLFAIIYFATFSTDTFNKVISKHAAEFHSKNEKGFLKYLIKRGLMKVALYGTIVLLIYFAAIPFLAEFLNIESYTELAITGVIAFFSLVGVVFSGALNGMQKFVWQNLSSVISTLLKFSIAILLVFLGFGVNGALFALVIGAIAGIFISYIPLKKLLKTTKPEKFNTKRIYQYALPVFFSSLFVILLITADQLLVKHFLSSADAGFYAAAGNIAKAIWFSSGFLTAALFPKIASLKARNLNASKILIKAIIYTSLLALIGLTIFYFAPSLVVGVLYGPQYAPISSLIFLFGLGMAFFSLIQLLVVYNLATDRYGFVYILALGLLAEVIGITYFHESLLQIVKIFLISTLSVLILTLIYTFSGKKENTKTNKTRIRKIKKQNEKNIH